MRYSLQQIGPEARLMLGLAVPVVLDQLGMMSMGFVDTIMVGRLGPEALGAVGVGASIYFAYMVFAWGTIGAITPIVAHAFGAGDHEEIERAVGQGFWVAIGLTIVGVALMQLAGPILHVLDEPEAIIPTGVSFIRSISIGMIATLWYSVLRAFTVGLGRMRITMVISFGAAGINIIADYLLIYGKLGLPALGPAGSGLATAIVQWAMFGAMLLYTLREGSLKRYRIFHAARRPDLAMIGRIVRLGAPIGGGNTLEMGVFGLTSLLMGKIGTIALASHQIALNVASITFMVPLGVSMAITTRVGQFLGARNLPSATLAGWVGTALAGLFMMATALLFITLPGGIIGIYTKDAEVIDYATGLLMIAGAFQIFDGVQVAAQGALRGLKDTTVPMMTNLVAYWLVGLPAGYLLAFVFRLGGQGLWWGLTAGLAAAALMHSIRFSRMIDRFREAQPEISGAIPQPGPSAG